MTRAWLLLGLLAALGGCTQEGWQRFNEGSREQFEITPQLGDELAYRYAPGASEYHDHDYHRHW